MKFPGGVGAIISPIKSPKGKRIKGPEYIWGRGHRGRTQVLVGQVSCGQRGRSHYSQSDTRAIKNGAGFEFTNWRKNFNFESFKKIKFLKNRKKLIYLTR